jgi:hypothetical protein
LSRSLYYFITFQVNGEREVATNCAAKTSLGAAKSSLGDLHATIYIVLGADPTTHFLDRSGRLVAAIEAGKAI